MSERPPARTSRPSQRGSDPARAMVFAVATAGTLAALEVAGRAARDGLFLSELAATKLPPTMMAAAALSIAGTFGLSGWLRRSRPDRVAPLALVFSGAAFVGIGALIPAAPRIAAVALYVHMTGLGPVILSSFWSVVNERFDPYTAKRTVSRMAAAGALGGVAGGIAAERIATLSGIPTLLLGLGVLSLLCGWGALRVGAPEGRAEASETDAGAGESGLRLLTRRPLLGQMATLMLAVAVAETLIDYALKVEAAAAFREGDALVRFFAGFYTVCGLLSFVIQTSLGSRFLRRFGLAAAVAMLPGSVALTGALTAATGKLWGYVLTRGAETVASLSFFRSGFQLLYTPVPPAVKRPAKVWVDVAAGSLGEVLGAGLVLGLLAVVPGIPTGWVVILAVAWSLAALALVQRIHRSYVRQLADSLRTGRVEFRADDALDATTARTIVESQMSLDRSSLLAQVRAFQADRETQAAEVGDDDVGAPVRDSAQDAAVADADPTPGWVAELCSGDPRRARHVLRLEAALDPGAIPARRRRLVPHVIPLLGVNAVAPEAEDFLREFAARVVGQLVDALLDADESVTVRVRLAGILAGVAEPRAMAGLWRGVESADFSVRLACARGAARIATRERELAPEPAAVYARIQQELGVGDDVWSRQGRRGPAGPGDRSVLLGRGALRSVSRSLEQVFTLLSLVHEREVMGSVLAGLASDDASLRGTALEYLESVLPANLRDGLWPRLHADADSAHSERSREEIADELLRSTAGLVVDRDALGGGD